ncbi:hypothetical protein RCG23_00410 [Neobacillus sp. PS3-34]|uniref:hypothetical protein n=1 Tax=Neobacillus sp. PS3-34 TaxID=3070678 RepID=UPI0027DF9687|nr:hypothetical protein [Neobacillus sp. PS3-34]WML48653.1 hypothetical protein RCG23_00410 [Neobacillus sp. PS3-34]
MKNLLAGSLFVLCISLLGCSPLNNNEVTAKLGEIQTNPVEQVQDLTIVEAISKTITFHNDLIRGTSKNDFPPKMKKGQIISKEIKIGGPSGHTTRLNKSVEAKKDGSHYIVTLIKNYNVTVNGIEAKSIWKYDVSDEGVKMLDKKEDDNVINGIK